MAIAMSLDFLADPTVIEDPLPPVEEGLDPLVGWMRAGVGSGRKILIAHWQQIEIESCLMNGKDASFSITRRSGKLVRLRQHVAQFCPLIGVWLGGKFEAVR